MKKTFAIIIGSLLLTSISTFASTNSDIAAQEKDSRALVSELKNMDLTDGTVKEVTAQLRRITKNINQIDEIYNDGTDDEISEDKLKQIGAILDEANALSNIANQRLTSLTVTKKAADQIEFLAAKAQSLLQ